MILATLRDLAKTLGCRPDQADDVVRSEPSARAALSRRGLFKAAGAVAAGSAFGFGAPTLVAWSPMERFMVLEQLYSAGILTYQEVLYMADL